MRQRFEQQIRLGQIPVSEAEMDPKSRDPYMHLMRALKEKFPCRRIKQLDKRYRTKYHMSMIENLLMIRNHGLPGFLEKENNRWLCPECGAPVSVHRDNYFQCGFDGVHKEVSED